MFHEILNETLHNFIVLHLISLAEIDAFHSFISFASFIQWHKNPCPYQNFHHSHSWKIQFIRNFLRQISCFQGCDIEACLYKLQDNCLQSCFALNTCVQLIDLILLKQDTLSSVVWGHLSVRFKIKINCFKHLNLWELKPSRGLMSYCFCSGTAFVQILEIK